MGLRAFFAKRWRSAAAGAVLATVVGIIFLSVENLGEGLGRHSLDLPFAPSRPRVDITNLVVISMDDSSANALKQDWTEAIWDREHHARLVRRLTRSGARAIVFDVLFDRPASKEKERDQRKDAELVSAVRDAVAQKVPVFFSTVLDRTSYPGSNGVVDVFTPVDPFEELKSVATGWGRAEALADGDFADKPRRHAIDVDIGLAEKVASVLEPEAAANLPFGRWINFYGPPGSLLNKSYSDALDPERVPDAFFSNRVCFIGAQTTIGLPGGKSTDEWHTPYAWWREDTGKMAGVELAATIYLNLIRGDWLRRMPGALELLLCLGMGVVLGAGLSFFRPVHAVLGGLILAILIAASASWLMWNRQIWFTWLIPAAIQMPVSVVWSIHAHTRRLARENRTLQEELGWKTAPGTAAVAGAMPVPLQETERAAVPQNRAGLGGDALEIPDHTPLRCVGKGAYGEVWLARNIFGACHVVKVIRRQNFEHDEPYDREFRGIEKFMPISRLHPGLVQILHAARNEAGRYFLYVMEPADDENSGAIIRADAYSPRNLATEMKRRGRLPANECVQLGLRLAEALEFLHGNGLVHRDIKPANIIFVRNEPKLADIGLVTDIASHTHDVSFVGTPGYIPPEGPGRPGADIFSLGRVLYEISMGLARSRFPELPPDILDWPDHELALRFNQVILRACDDDVRERYATAVELCADLRALGVVENLTAAKAPQATATEVKTKVEGT